MDTSITSNGGPKVRHVDREQSIEVNLKELESRSSVLTASPRLVTLGTHNSCNAKCVFSVANRGPVGTPFFTFANGNR